jgi:TonB family protein
MGQPLTLPPDEQDPPISGGSESADHRGLVPEILPPLADVSSLARVLTAHGAGDFSPQVALDLVLHEIAEHLRQATSADAAALALRQGEEMVCRAAAGASAPDLGTRIDLRSGLSGVCLQTGEWQYCQDCEADPRVDLETCRRLGARSFLVMPVIDEAGPFGVIQVTSAAPNAFSQKDVETLRQSGRSIVWARRQVSQPRSAETEAPDGPMPAPELAPMDEFAKIASEPLPETEKIETSRELENRALDMGPETVAASLGYSSDRPEPIFVVQGIVRADARREQNSVIAMQAPPQLSDSPIFHEQGAHTISQKRLAYRSHEVITAILGFLVVCAALLLGTLIGIRFGWQKAVRLPIAGKSAPDGKSNRTAPSTQPATNAIPSVLETTEATLKNAAIPSRPSPHASHPDSAAAPNERVGDLVIFQNDRVVYRQSGAEAGTSGVPVQQASATTPGAIAIPADVAATRLVRRVDPEYPAEATKKGISGSVRLQALINAQGEVASLGLIEGNSILAASAMKAVRQWRYQPYLVNGVPTATQTEVNLTFVPPGR